MSFRRSGRRHGKGSTITYENSTGGPREVVRVRVDRQRSDLDLERKRQTDLLAALPATERLDFIEHELHGDGDMWEDDDAAMQQSAFSIPPPGEEGSEFSNAGAEGALFTIVHSMVGRRHRIDMRTRHDRVQKQINGWGRQLPALKSAYLHWKVHGTPVEEASDLVAPTFSIMVYSFRGIRQEFFCSSAGSASINETLVLHGLIGSAPETPRVAFTFNFLETFRQLHRVCPRLSLDAVARTLHNLHQRPRKPYLTQQLSNAYDVYLSIQRAISADAQSALKRDPTIQAQLLCPPCMYRLEQEMPLQPSMLVACDGNNSLKLVDATFLAGDRRSDDRRLPSFRFLEPEVVDKFKDDVSNAAAAKTTRSGSAAQPSAELNASTANPTSMPASSSVVPTPAPTSASILAPVSPSTATPAPASMPAPPSIDLPNTRTDEVPWIEAHELGRAFEQQVDACVERWRAAGSDAKKKTVELFAIAGVFLTVCRHGHVLIMCDMIRSGELMKYPIANTNYIIDTYGRDICEAYDIMCEFMKTLRRSSIAEKVRESRLVGVVPAFHGHAHSRDCQVYWHPRYVEGVGMEDFEECERLFSGSNELAPTTRTSSPFHRRQQILEYLDFHDADKYANHGRFLFNNYRAALQRIKDNGSQLAMLERKLGTSAEDYERYLQEERTYLTGLKKEPPDVTQRFEYMEALDRLRKAELESAIARADYDRFNRAYEMNESFTGNAGKIKSRYTRTANRVVVLDEEVARLEDVMGLHARWEPDIPEYVECLKELQERKYRRALDELERLVVQRLLELTKLNMSGIGYKLREKIRKALHTRAEAIRNALERYNSAAKALNPPRQTLTWTHLFELVELGDLALLQHSRVDIRGSAWAQPLNRQAANLYFEMKRAREEIVRANVEIRRQITFMVDNYNDHLVAIEEAATTDPNLAAELQRRLDHQLAIDTEIAQRLLSMSQLRGFTGSLLPGVRIGKEGFRASDKLPPWAINIIGIIIVDGENSECQPASASGDSAAFSADPAAAPDPVVSTSSHATVTASSSSATLMPALAASTSQSNDGTRATVRADEARRRALSQKIQELKAELASIPPARRSDASSTMTSNNTAASGSPVQLSIPQQDSTYNAQKRKRRRKSFEAEAGDSDEYDSDEALEDRDAGVMENQSIELFEVLADTE